MKVIKPFEKGIRNYVHYIKNLLDSWIFLTNLPGAGTGYIILGQGEFGK